MAKAKIITNTLYQLLAKFISTFATLFITIIITRFLGAKTWGDYAIVISYITFFYVFTEFGVNSIGVKYFSEKKQITYNDFYNFFLVRLIYTILVLIIASTILPFFNYTDFVANAIRLLFIALFCFSVSSSFNAVYQTKLLYKNLFYATLVFAVVNLTTFLFIVFYLGINNFLFLFISIVIGEVIKLLVSFFLAKRHLVGDLNFSINKILFTYLLRASIPLGIAIAFNTLMTQVDKLMLSVMVPSEQVGYYALSYKLFDLILVVPTFFMNAVYPLLNIKYTDKSEYSIFYSKSYYILGVMSILITFLAIILSPFFIPFVWGNSMFPAVLSFQLLVLATGIFYLSSPVSWVYVIENKQHILIIFYASGFIFNFLVNLVTIPVYGYIGAAITTGFTEILILFLLEIYRIKKLKARFLYRKIPSFNANLYNDIKGLLIK